MAEIEPFDFDKEVVRFLQQWRTASLATINEHGQPHAANVQYAAAGMVLYFVSSPKSAHSQHIASNPNVAMTVYAHVNSPDQIHGIQLEGRCRLVTEKEELDRAWASYTKTFPFVLENPAIEERLRSEQFYWIFPDWMRYIDNRRGFGFKHECVIDVFE